MKMDIAVILIFALTIFFTMRKGFVSTIAGFLKGIASVAAAYFLAGPLGKFIEGTSVGAATEFRISEQLSSRLGSSEAYNSLPGIFREGVDSISSGFIAETAADINHVAWIVLSFVLIIIVMNTTRYAGTCYMAGDQVSVAFCPMSTQTYYPFNTVIHHEAGGHGFANLGDEYHYGGTISSSEAAELQSSASEYGWYQNLDVTSNASSIKWSSFLTDPDYSPNTSIYEGGYSYLYGVWRPTYESCMNGMYGNFNAPSRYAIYKKIMERSGESWSWASFKAYDQKNLSMSFNGHNAPLVGQEELPAHCPPVSIPIDSLPR